MSQLFFNDNEPYVAEWLGNLFPGQTVSRESIADLQARNLHKYDRVHLFAGIGGWEYALQLAGWPADVPVWTGSCPCQPFSIAGKRGGESDERHLWPEMLRLVSECKPPVVFGEQVASPAGRKWLAGVRADLEALGYRVAAADLCAAGVGAPHGRQRLFWAATHIDSKRAPRLVKNGSARIARQWDWRGQEDLQLVACSPNRHGDRWPRPLVRKVDDGIPNRVGRLRAYGNAIVPQVAATFIVAFMQAMEEEAIGQDGTDRSE